MSGLEALYETIGLIERRARQHKPAVVHDLLTEVKRRISEGADRSDAHRWYLEQLVIVVHAPDGSGFGPAVDDDDVPTSLPHAGGRPKLMGDDERHRFLKFMRATPGPIKSRVDLFLQSNPWCPMTHEQLAAQWRNHKPLL